MQTSELDGKHEREMEMPEESLTPLVTALGILVVVLGLLWAWYWVAGAGALIMFGSMAHWLWPPERTPEEAGVAT
jgi:hypothetical protein